MITGLYARGWQALTPPFTTLLVSTETPTTFGPQKPSLNYIIKEVLILQDAYGESWVLYYGGSQCALWHEADHHCWDIITCWFLMSACVYFLSHNVFKKSKFRMSDLRQESIVGDSLLIINNHFIGQWWVLSIIFLYDDIKLYYLIFVYGLLYYKNHKLT